MARHFFDSGPGVSGFQGPVTAAGHNQLMESLQHVPRPAGLRTQEVDPSHWAMKMPVSSVPSNSQWSEEFGNKPLGVSTSRFNDITSTLNGGFFDFHEPSSTNTLVTGPINEYHQSPAFFQPSFTSLPRGPLAMHWDQEFMRMDTKKGKGKATDMDFEAAFTRAAASVTEDGSRIVEVQDDAESLESAFERANISDSVEAAGDSDRGDYLSDFQK